jgi:RimJ/RimL family protein N-acetyltransferase
MNAVQSWAQSLGIGELHLLVTSPNATAIRFYEKCGFAPTGFVHPYPNDPGLTEFEMVKYLRKGD